MRSVTSIRAAVFLVLEAVSAPSDVNTRELESGTTLCRDNELINRGTFVFHIANSCITRLAISIPFAPPSSKAWLIL